MFFYFSPCPLVPSPLVPTSPYPTLPVSVSAVSPWLIRLCKSGYQKVATCRCASN
jgi:hypothetical protein